MSGLVFLPQLDWVWIFFVGADLGLHMEPIFCEEVAKFEYNMTVSKYFHWQYAPLDLYNLLD